MTNSPPRRSPDGRYRSSLRPGMRVAIVLKKDQPTGKRTIGEISALLTPSDFHPRGVKVRLADGQVGRVQEIIAGVGPSVASAEVAPEDHIDVMSTPDLILVLVRSGDGAYYGRKAVREDGTMITVLGLDAPCPRGRTPEEVATVLAKSVGPDGSSVRSLASEKIDHPELGCAIIPFLAEGEEVYDDQHELWEWTGWLSMRKLAVERDEGRLSPESELLLRLVEAAQADPS